ncbi:hypothetical protein V6N12_000363 [Hibiscus sabdariffa]|uniref:Uncharacterized protein n=1 Tax=Hibiscus sabdariffa TaxID=183260 RepID=A0ABR2BI24_9ROSI
MDSYIGENLRELKSCPGKKNEGENRKSKGGATSRDANVEAIVVANIEMTTNNGEAKDAHTEARRQKDIVVRNATKTQKVKVELEDKAKALVNNELEVCKFRLEKERAKVIDPSYDNLVLGLKAIYSSTIRVEYPLSGLITEHTLDATIIANKPPDDPSLS